MASKSQHIHFLLVPLMSQSHIIPLTDFAKLLVKHGVFVSIITTPLNAIKYKEITDHVSAQNLNIQMIPIKFPCQEAGLPEGCESMDALDSMEIAQEFFLACEMLQTPLENLIEKMEMKPSCIVSTNALPWTQMVALKFKIPRYIFETVSCFTLLCSHNISRADLEESVISDSEPFMVPDVPHKIEFTKAQLPKKLGKTSENGAGFKEQMEQAKELARGTLVNSFEELEFLYAEGCRKERKKIWCIGPVSLCNKGLFEKSNRGKKASICEDYCITWLDSMKPNSVIYACFGSLCHISVEQIKEIGLGLESSSFPFIWIISKQDYSAEVEKWFAEENFDERVRGRGLIIRGWAPQVLILSHLSVGGFLTHCGWNSTLEGICAGVPMITWPMFAEQFYNEKFIVHVLKIGVRIGVEACKKSSDRTDQNETFVKRDQVKKSIEKLMDEEEKEEEEEKGKRKRAKELANMARNAIEAEGSSYLNVLDFIKDVMKQFH